MYSAGLIFFELLTLRSCYSTVAWETVLKTLRSDARSMLKKYEPFLPEAAKKTISVLLRESPRKRASAMEIRQELRKLNETNKLTEPAEKEEQKVNKSKPKILKFGWPNKIPEKNRINSRRQLVLVCQ